MCELDNDGVPQVHCRTGSLENRGTAQRFYKAVHCRTGSLEMLIMRASGADMVHCRTGSLESSG